MDKDLEFLRDANDEMFAVFVETMIEKGGFSEFITISEEYKKYGKDYKKYIGTIIEEFLAYGSNTFLNIFGNYNSYKKILCDVAEKLKVNFNEKQSVENIEEKVLEKVLEKAIEEMSPQERAELDGLAKQAKSNYGSINVGAEASFIFINIFRAGGFASYKLTVIIVNAIAKAILGRGLSLAGNAALTRAMSIFAGPIGLAITAIWSLIDIAGTAYRVTIPCTILIAAMRREQSLRQYKDFDF